MSIATSIFDAALSTLELVKAYLGGDAKQDLEPVHSSVYDLAATEWNTIVAGLAEVAMRLRFGNLCSFGFSQPNATASQSGVELARWCAGDAAVKRAVAPLAGSVVGISVRVENARTAGTLTVAWTKGGASQSLSVTIDGTNTQTNYATQLPGTETFAAGDELGVEVTTSGTWAAGATPSLSVDLFAAYGS